MSEQEKGKVLPFRPKDNPVSTEVGDPGIKRRFANFEQKLNKKSHLKLVRPKESYIPTTNFDEKEFLEKYVDLNDRIAAFQRDKLGRANLGLKNVDGSPDNLGDIEREYQDLSLELMRLTENVPTEYKYLGVEEAKRRKEEIDKQT